MSSSSNNAGLQTPLTASASNNTTGLHIDTQQPLTQPTNGQPAEETISKEATALLLAMEDKKFASKLNTYSESERLNGENFLDWRFLLTNRLQHRKLQSVIDLAACPSGLSPIVWEEANTIVKNEILNSVKPRFITMLKNCTTAFQMSQTLTRVCLPQTRSSGSAHHDRLIKMRYSIGGKKKLVEHILEFDSIADIVISTGFMAMTDEYRSDILVKTIPAVPFSHLIVQRHRLSYEELKESLIQHDNDMSSNAVLYPEYAKQKGESAFTTTEGYKKKKFQKAPHKHSSNTAHNSGGHCKLHPNGKHTNAECRAQKDKGESGSTDGKSGNGNFAMTINDAVVPGSDDTTWVYDSGASQHFSPHRHLFVTMKKVTNKSVFTISGEKIEIEGIGNILCIVNHNGKEYELTLTDVWYGPKLKCNLFALGRADNMGFRVSSLNGELFITKPGFPTVRGYRTSGNLFTIKFGRPSASAFLLASTPATGDVWHARLGHASPARCKAALEGVNIKPLAPSPDVCEICRTSKSHRQPFNSTHHKSTNVIERIHSDYCYVGVPSVSGYTGFITFIDDFTGVISVNLVKAKSECLQKFSSFKSQVETATGKKICILRSDGGGEYLSNEFNELLESSGIQRELTVAHSPQQNGRAERLNRTLLEMTRCLLNHGNMPKEFWAEAIDTAAYIISRLPTAANDGKSPFEAWYGYAPKLSQLRVFGCVAYAHIHKTDREDKLGSTATKCLFLGYSRTRSAYRVYNPETKLVHESHDVTFDESSFPGIGNGNTQETVNDNSIVVYGGVPTATSIEPPVAAPSVPAATSIESPVAAPRRRVSFAPLQNPNASESTADTSSIDTPVGNTHTSAPTEAARAAEVIITGAGPVVEDETAVAGSNSQSRIDHSTPDSPALTEASAESEDVFEEALEGNAMEHEPRVTVTKSGRVSKPPDHFTFNHINLVHEQVSNSLTINDPHSPDTRKEAISGPDAQCWLKAEVEELSKIKNAGTYQLVTRPKDRKVVGCRFAYKLKVDATGKPTVYKARLVAKGYSQIPGVDFGETFAPTVRLESLRVLFAIRSINNWPPILHVDWVSAFLNGELEETIYMEQPPGHSEGNGKVWLLKRPLYGLKQAPRQWHLKLKEFFESNGFIRLKTDPGLFCKNIGTDKIIVGPYVDDNPICGSNEQLNLAFKDVIEKSFATNDLGVLKNFLSMLVVQSPGNIYVSQPGHTLSIVRFAKQLDAKPANTPMSPDKTLTSEDGPLTEEELEQMSSSPYGTLVGKLLYVNITTRPDISYAVNRLCRYLKDPGPKHWEAAKQVVRYLKNTADYELKYYGNKMDLTGYCDADWAGDTENRKSTCGFIFFLGKGPISWSTKQQSVVARSSAEAEYLALSYATEEAIHLRQLLAELGFPQKEATIIYSDNISAIKLSNNPTFHKRTKTIDIRHHFIRDHVEKGEIKFIHCGTKDMLADIFTKPLHGPRHRELCTKIGLTPLKQQVNKEYSF